MQEPQLKRSISYNDIKRRRMLRSSSKDRLTSASSHKLIIPKPNIPPSHINTLPVENFVMGLKTLVENYERENSMFRTTSNSVLPSNVKPRNKRINHAKNFTCQTRLKQQTLDRLNFFSSNPVEKSEETNKTVDQYFSVKILSPIRQKGSWFDSGEVSGLSMLQQLAQDGQKGDEDKENKPPGQIWGQEGKREHPLKPLLAQCQVRAGRKREKRLPRDFFN